MTLLEPEQADVKVVLAGEERLEEIAALWASMHAHHSAIVGELPRTRPVSESWRRRRPQYESWLADGTGWLLIAEQHGKAVGYAFVTVGDGPPTWDLGEKVAELESLVVSDGERGSGVGARLVSSARELARRAGAQHMAVGVAHANSGALHFYEREGFRPFYVLLLGETAGRGADS